MGISDKISKYIDAIKFMNDPEAKLVGYSASGKIKAVREVLDWGTNPNAKHEGIPALEAAIKQGNEVIARKLLNEGADPDIRFKDGYTALMVTVAQGRKSLSRKLLKEGANPNKKAVKEYNTPLHIAVLKKRPGMIKLLVKEGASPDIENENGKTPLELAEYLNHTSSIGILRNAKKTQENEEHKRKESKKPTPTENKLQNDQVSSSKKEALLSEFKEKIEKQEKILTGLKLYFRGFSSTWGEGGLFKANKKTFQDIKKRTKESLKKANNLLESIEKTDETSTEQRKKIKSFEFPPIPQKGGERFFALQRTYEELYAPKNIDSLTDSEFQKIQNLAMKKYF